VRFTRSRITKAVALACATLVSPAMAATIYGSIQRSSQPVQQQEVVLTCGDTEVARATTDDRGKYRISANRTGNCRVTVGSASGNVVLYPERPTQYNFEVRDGTLFRVR